MPSRSSRTSTQNQTADGNFPGQFLDESRPNQTGLIFQRLYSIALSSEHGLQALVGLGALFMPSRVRAAVTALAYCAISMSSREFPGVAKRVA